MFIKRLLVIGVGLIGGSFALALKRANCVGHVIGVGRDAGNLGTAIENGVIDSVSADIAGAARDADFILVATPVRQMPDVMRALAGNLADDAVVTDAGSTKQDVIAAARGAFGVRAGQFVPAHPIAGSEKSGAAAAESDLYRDRNVVLTPLAENPPQAVARVREAWLACGARVVEMDAARHDLVLAAVSHLPHMLAYALVDDLAKRENADQLFAFAAGGFRDFTRIASSSPEMWLDIALNNRAALLGEIDAYQAKLAELRRMIEARDGKALERCFADARAARDAWLANTRAGAQGSPE